MGRPNYPLKMVGARLLVCLAFPVIAAALPAMLAGEEGSVQPKPEAMNSTAPAPDTKQFVDPKDVPKEWVPEMPKDMPKDWPKDIPYTAEAWAKLTPAEFAKYIPGYEDKKKNATQAETDKEAQTSSMDKKLSQFWDPMSGNFVGPDGKKYDPSSLKPVGSAKGGNASGVAAALSMFVDPASGNYVGPDGKKYDPSTLKPVGAEKKNESGTVNMAQDTSKFTDVPKEWVPDMPKDAPKDWPKDVPFTPEAWAKLTPAEFAKYIPGYEEKKKNATEAMGEAGEAKIKGFYDPTKDMATRTDTDGVLMGFDAKTGESKPLVPGVTAPSTGNMSDAAINLAAGENKISTFFDPTKDVGTVNCFDPKTGESKPCLPGGEKKGNASETNLMQTDGQIKQFFDPTADVGKINCIDPTTGKSGPCPGVPKIPGMGGAEKKNETATDATENLLQQPANAKISGFFDPTADVGKINCMDPATGKSSPCMGGAEKKGNATEVKH